MLPRAHRMVDPADFRSAIRSGSRAGNAVVVVHCRTDEEPQEPLVGFVVAKRDVPKATARNRVRRQLRHLMASRIPSLPVGARVVVRVNAGAVGRHSADLGSALDNALGRAWRKWEVGGGR
ncbi:ribonuclease P protein component [Schaalia sp. 19OD2882]|uniref:ribonuclease P protein component n=1 Tax=Schaalia sp. 19OD2882 TaxID=2794089 RepID=UPI001C1F0064|nr:ribonuclease P protein component [Schaalia sp. 19OD2882]QWW19574.1 ribonuclease P protein component [Schaalia sp. 19OD2882]